MKRFQEIKSQHEIDLEFSEFGRSRRCPPGCWLVFVLAFAAFFYAAIIIGLSMWIMN